MTRLPDPLSRKDRQRQTREALIFAARAAFARDGYHAASLDVIAREAGFSKGAIYSNFEGKAGLFLAVMDANMEIGLAAGGVDVFERADEPVQRSAEAEEALTGFALATLEFVAAAARDEALSGEMGRRLAAVTRWYAASGERSRAADEPLSPAEIGTLLAALDQGAALLILGGGAAIDQGLIRTGMRRLADPARAQAKLDDDATRAGFALHDQDVQRRLRETMGEG